MGGREREGTGRDGQEGRAAVPGGEESELLEVGQCAQIDRCGEVEPDRARQVLVVTEAAPRQRPLPAFGAQGALPQQHRKCGFVAGAGCPALSNLEHRGQHFVVGAHMGHVFDYKSKTSRK